MADNMAHVPKSESETEVLKITPLRNGKAGIALTSKREKQPLKCLQHLEELLLGVVIRRKALSACNILQENDHPPCQVSSSSLTLPLWGGK